MRHLECMAMQFYMTQEAPEMGLKVAGLWRTIKRELPIRFGHEQMTSYGGLELLRRYFHGDRPTRLRQALAGHQVGCDYCSAHLVMLVVGLLAVGARRLRHLRYLADDCLFVRLMLWHWRWGKIG